MDPVTIGTSLAAAAGVLTSIGTVIRSRAERRKLAAEAEDVADAATTRALEAVSQTFDTTLSAMRRHSEAQDARIAAQDARIETLDRRLTTATTAHGAAVVHIADREVWTADRWPGARPADLPPVPASLVADVVAVAPALAPILPHVVGRGGGDTRTNAQRRRDDIADEEDEDEDEDADA